MKWYFRLGFWLDRQVHIFLDLIGEEMPRNKVHFNHLTTLNATKLEGE